MTINIREKLRWFKKIICPKHKGCMPEQIIFFITNKCNLACQHCFYWSHLNKESKESTLEEIDKFSQTLGPFSFLTLTGGEPYLRDDITEIIKIFKRNNSVSKVSIPTNGLSTDRIIKTTERILESIDKIDLSIKISIDGLAKKHDEIRGMPGAFLKTIETYKRLMQLKKKYPDFKVGIILTYSGLNQNSLPETLDYIEDKLNPDILSLSYVRGDVRDISIKEVDVNNYVKLYKKILYFLLDKKNEKTNLYYRFYKAYKSRISDMIVKIINQDQQLYACHAGNLFCTIDSELNVYPCELWQDKMGNLREHGYDFKSLWFSNSADLIRKRIKDTCCYCTFECSLQITTFFSLKGIASLLFRMI